MWHTSVVVAGREWYYGGGVQEAVAGASPFGTPAEVVRLGWVALPQLSLQCPLQSFLLSNFLLVSGVAPVGLPPG